MLNTTDQRLGASPEEPETLHLPGVPATSQGAQNVPLGEYEMDGEPLGALTPVLDPPGDSTVFQPLADNLTATPAGSDLGPLATSKGSEAEVKASSSVVGDAADTALQHASGRLWFALEIPAGQQSGRFLEETRNKLRDNQVAVVSIFPGHSARSIPAVVVEVASPFHLLKGKRQFQDYKEVKLVTSDVRQGLLVLVNKLESLPEKQLFDAALEEFGKARMSVIEPFNVLVDFEDPKSSEACLAAGGIYVNGRRFLVRPHYPRGTAPPPSKPFVAWLMDLPSYTKDAHLHDLIPEAIDWQIIRSASKDASRAEVFAKVMFPSQAARQVAVDRTIMVHEKRRFWSIEPVCSICRSADHQALTCTLRNSKRFGPSMITSGISFRDAMSASVTKQVPSKATASTTSYSRISTAPPAAVEQVLADVKVLKTDLTNLVSFIGEMAQSFNIFAQVMAKMAGIPEESVPCLSTPVVASVPTKKPRTLTIPEDMSDAEFDRLLEVFKTTTITDQSAKKAQIPELPKTTTDTRSQGKAKFSPITQPPKPTPPKHVSIAKTTTVEPISANSSAIVAPTSPVEPVSTELSLMEVDPIEKRKDKNPVLDIIDILMKSAPALDNSRATRHSNRRTETLARLDAKKEAAQARDEKSKGKDSHHH